MNKTTAVLLAGACVTATTLLSTGPADASTQCGSSGWRYAGEDQNSTAKLRVYWKKYGTKSVKLAIKSYDVKKSSNPLLTNAANYDHSYGSWWTKANYGCKVIIIPKSAEYVLVESKVVDRAGKNTWVSVWTDEWR